MKKGKINLLIGLCSDSYKKTERFLLSFIDSIEFSKHFEAFGDIVIVRALQYKEKPIQLLPKIQAVFAARDIKFIQSNPTIEIKNFKYKKNLFGIHGGNQYHIAAQRNRTILAIKEIVRKKTFDIYAILDDDLIFENAVLHKQKDHEPKVFIRFVHTFDFFKGLIKIKEYVKDGPVIGGNTGCPPIPSCSAFFSMIKDRQHGFSDVFGNEESLIKAQKKDYYYDLTENDDQSSQRGYWIPYKHKNQIVYPDLKKLLLGIVTTRPLLFDKERLLLAPVPSTLRGGNTYFGSWKQLSEIPHISLMSNGLSTRRSDMIAARIFSHKKRQYYQTYFPLGHFRLQEKNKTNIEEYLLFSFIRETFGVVFLRTLNSYLAGKNWKKEWDIRFTKRLNDLRKMFISIQQQIEISSNLFNKNEQKMIRSLASWDKVQDSLNQHDKIMKNQSIEILENIDQILIYWRKELKK